MKKLGKVTLVSLSIIAVGTALYFFVFKKSISDYRKMVMDFIKYENLKNPSEFSDDDVKKFQDLTNNKMTEQELKDTYIILTSQKNPSLNQKYKNDTAFLARFADLSKKYDIFT
jgi:hypothetical protein